jgi:hypothetical protein
VSSISNVFTGAATCADRVNSFNKLNQELLSFKKIISHINANEKEGKFRIDEETKKAIEGINLYLEKYCKAKNDTFRTYAPINRPNPAKI